MSENILPNGYDVNQKVRFTEDVVQPEFMDYMNDWAKRLEKKGLWSGIGTVR